MAFDTLGWLAWGIAVLIFACFIAYGTAVRREYREDVERTLTWFRS